MLRGLLAVTFVCGANTALACEQSIARCTFNGGAKTLNLCLAGASVTYAYGPRNAAPELALETQIAALDYTPWAGVGRTIFETVTFTNEGHSYQVFVGADRAPDAEPPFGGITVMRGDTELATLACDPGSVLWDGAAALTEAKRAIGQCWDYGTFRWGPCG